MTDNDPTEGEINDALRDLDPEQVFTMLDDLAHEFYHQRRALLIRRREILTWIEVHNASCTHHRDDDDVRSTLVVCEAQAHLHRLYLQWIRRWHALHQRIREFAPLFTPDDTIPTA